MLTNFSEGLAILCPLFSRRTVWYHLGKPLRERRPRQTQERTALMPTWRGRMATYVILSRFSAEAFREPHEFKKLAEAVPGELLFRP